MKPAPFRYFDPDTVDDVVDLLGEWGDEGKLLAGGQTLGPMLNFRLLAPRALIDLNRVESLSYRARLDDGGLGIGALTRQQMLEDDADVAVAQPLVAAAMPLIAHRAIRNRGTVGGSISHADPAAEWGGLVAALDATMVIRHRKHGEREVAAADFYKGLLQTALEPDELLSEIRLPAWPSGAGWSIREFSRRHGDFALTGIACVIALDPHGRCSKVRLAAFGVEANPRRLAEAESALLGEPPDDKLIAEAARLASKGVEPLDDRHASAEYRRQLVAVLMQRAVAETLSRCN
jgi:CO/xanthine dehydrogenase FAD-binding subunit